MATIPQIHIPCFSFKLDVILSNCTCSGLLTVTCSCMALSYSQLFVVFFPLLESWTGFSAMGNLKKSALFVNIVAPFQAHIHRICKLEGTIKISSVSPIRKCVHREPGRVTQTPWLPVLSPFSSATHLQVQPHLLRTCPGHPLHFCAIAAGSGQL